MAVGSRKSDTDALAVTLPGYGSTDAVVSVGGGCALPRDCLTVAFSYVPSLLAVCQLRLVCRAWNAVACQNLFWAKPLLLLRATATAPPDVETPIHSHLRDSSSPVLGHDRSGEWAEPSGYYCHAAFCKGVRRREREKRLLCVARCVACSKLWKVIDWLAGPLSGFVMLPLLFFAMDDIDAEFPACTWSYILSRPQPGPPPVPAVDGDDVASAAYPTYTFVAYWMMLQIALTMLVGWRLTATAWSATLAAYGTVSRLVHLVLGIMPFLFLSAQRLGSHASTSLIPLHFMVALEWGLLFAGYKSNSDDWHNPIYAPWYELFPERPAQRMSTFRLAVVHGVIVGLQDLALLVWFVKLDFDDFDTSIAVAPYLLLCSVVACFIVSLAFFACYVSYKCQTRSRNLVAFIFAYCLYLACSAVMMPFPLTVDHGPCG